MKFEPSDIQQEWLLKAVEIGFESPTKIAKAVGIAQSTYYFWRMKPEFMDWYLTNYCEQVIEKMREELETYNQQTKVYCQTCGSHNYPRDMLPITLCQTCINHLKEI